MNRMLWNELHLIRVVVHEGVVMMEGQLGLGAFSHRERLVLSIEGVVAFVRLSYPPYDAALTTGDSSQASCSRLESTADTGGVALMGSVPSVTGFLPLVTVAIPISSRG